VPPHSYTAIARWSHAGRLNMVFPARSLWYATLRSGCQPCESLRYRVSSPADFAPPSNAIPLPTLSIRASHPGPQSRFLAPTREPWPTRTRSSIWRPCGAMRVSPIVSPVRRRISLQLDGRFEHRGPAGAHFVPSAVLCLAKQSRRRQSQPPRRICNMTRCQRRQTPRTMACRVRENIADLAPPNNLVTKLCSTALPPNSTSSST